NCYYVVNAKWSPDSQFFVYSMASSGGHSPWSFPMMVYSREKKRIAGLSDMIDGEADAFAGFPLCRRAYAHGSDVENARLTGQQDSSHSRSRECVRQAAGFPCTHKSGPVNGAMSAPGGTTRASLPRRIWSTLLGASETIVVF